MRYTKYKTKKKGGSSMALRRVSQASRTMIRRPPRNLNTIRIKRATNAVEAARGAKKWHNTLTRDRQKFYNPHYKGSIKINQLEPISSIKVANFRGRIKRDYAEDCHGCLPVKKGEHVLILFEFKTTDKIKVQRERDGRKGKVPESIVEIII